jgi:ribosomal protein S12 methylthiotransferase
MIGRLKKAGGVFVDDPEQAETIIVNTCSFIEDAADESIEVILDLSQYKHSGSCERLIVTGCLPERYREDIVKELPEVDVFLGTGAFDQILKAIDAPRNSGLCVLPDPDLINPDTNGSPRSLLTSHLAYLKIAEGCSRDCTYCIIPKLRGSQKSRPLEGILSEAGGMLANGVKELILVAQDTTSYGRDLQPQTSISNLLKRLSRMAESKAASDGDIWLRVLYGHPESLVDDFIYTVADHPNVCPYFDIPIQHASDAVLKRMGRHYHQDDLKRLFDRIRKEVPNANLRTTIIVGFPGETDRDFGELMRFVENVNFDHLGVFIYSDSEDLPSHRMGEHIPAAVARERYDQLMSCQMDISARKTRQYIGRTLKVLIEESLENDLFAGRTSRQAPEVDGMTYVKRLGSSSNLKIGHFADIRVTDALEYDLVGETLCPT